MLKKFCMFIICDICVTNTICLDGFNVICNTQALMYWYVP